MTDHMQEAAEALMALTDEIVHDQALIILEQPAERRDHLISAASNHIHNWLLRMAEKSAATDYSLILAQGLSDMLAIRAREALRSRVRTLETASQARGGNA